MTDRIAAIRELERRRERNLSKLAGIVAGLIGATPERADLLDEQRELVHDFDDFAERALSTIRDLTARNEQLVADRNHADSIVADKTHSVWSLRDQLEAARLRIATMEAQQ